MVAAVLFLEAQMDLNDIDTNDPNLTPERRDLLKRARDLARSAPDVSGAVDAVRRLRENPEDRAAAADLDRAHDRLKAHVERMDELNSSFPETRKFLAARGLTRVSQLDQAGHAELKAHLEAVLALLTSKPKAD